MVPERIKPIAQARRKRFADKVLHSCSQVGETRTIDGPTTEHTTKWHLKYDCNISDHIRWKG